MAITVHVQNFQSIKDATVVVDGFTVITGTNNTGKSAFMRAVRAAFQNARGTSFIRHGADKCIVEIDFGDGRTLRWEKGRGKGDKPTYIIDGGKPIYPGQGVPEEVLALGIRPITVGKDDVWPQFAPQFTGQLFLINQPGSVLAEAVSDVDRVSQLNQALRLAESDKRAAASELKIRLVDEETQTKDLTKFKGLDEVVADVSALEAQGQQLVRIEKAMAGVTDLRDRLVKARGAVEALAGIDQVRIPPDDDLESLETTLNDLGTMMVLGGRLERSRKAVSDLAWTDLVQIPPDADLASVEKLLQDRDSFESLRERWGSATRQANHWQTCLEVVGKDEDLDSANLERYHQALQVLEGFRDRLATVARKIEVEGIEVEKAEVESAQVDEDLRLLLDGLEECPLCGSAIAHSH